MGRRGLRGPYGLTDGVIGSPTTAGKRVDEKLAKLLADPRLQAAALIGHLFKVDPVTVLEESDPLKVLVRVAAHNFVQNEQDKANKRRSKK